MSIDGSFLEEEGDDDSWMADVSTPSDWKDDMEFLQAIQVLESKGTRVKEEEDDGQTQSDQDTSSSERGTILSRSYAGGGFMNDSSEDGSIPSDQQTSSSSSGRSPGRRFLLTQASLSGSEELQGTDESSDTQQEDSFIDDEPQDMNESQHLRYLRSIMIDDTEEDEARTFEQESNDSSFSNPSSDNDEMTEPSTSSSSTKKRSSDNPTEIQPKPKKVRRRIIIPTDSSDD